MKKYFNTPTQVRYYDRGNKRWFGGIAHKDEIICGCCGSIIEISDLEEDEIVVYKR